MRAVSALLCASGCVFGAGKDDSAAGDVGPADGRWVGSCSGAVVGTADVGTTTDTTTSAVPAYYTGGTDTGANYYYYYYSGYGYTTVPTVYTLTFDPAILTLQDAGGALDGTFGYTLSYGGGTGGYQGAPWVVQGTRSGDDVFLDVTGLLMSGTTSTITSDLPVTFDLALDGDTLDGYLIAAYTEYGMAATPASSTTTWFSGATYGGYSQYLLCTFTRQRP